MILVWVNCARADVVHDGSLSGGLHIPLTGPNYEILEAQGLRPGGGANLFHSFERFNLTSSESATFHSSTGIQNILARITGGTASSIDGKIISKDTDANLYLLNPAGMMFGPHATLDLNGSFYASSASYLRLKDGTKFNAVPGPDDLLLSSAPPEAFGFLGPGAGSITVDGSQLSVTPGKNLGLVGGVVTVKNGARLTASDGAVQILAVGSAGEIKLDGMGGSPGYSSTAAVMADVTLDNATLDASGPKGGAVFIRGGRIVVTNNSQVAASTTGSGPGRGIDVEGQGDVLINGLSNLYVGNAGPGQPGSIHIGGANVYVGDALGGAGYVTTATEPGGTLAGNVQMSVQGHLQVTGGATITSHGKDSGAIDVTAGAITLSGVGSGFGAGTIEAGGHAGSITLNVAGDLQILGGARAGASAIGGGTGGRIEVNAKDIILSGEGAPGLTAIFADTTGVGAGAGPGGDLVINVTDSLQILSGARIGSITFGTGNGGNLSISAGNVLIKRGNSNIFTGIASGTYYSGADAGVGGPISLIVGGELRIEDGGIIEARTAGPGAAGGINVTAGTAVLNAHDTGLETAILTDTSSSNFPGTGNVQMNVQGLLQVAGGAYITTNGLNTGAIDITAGAITMTGVKSGISADAFQSGIRTDTYQSYGHAGSLKLNVTGDLQILGGALAGASANGGGTGGRVEVNAKNFILSGKDSPSFSSIGADSSGTGPGSGPGGDLVINVTDSLQILSGARIGSNTFGLGHGGNLQIMAGDVLIKRGNSNIFTAISAGTYSTNPDAGAGGVVRLNVVGELRVEDGGVIEVRSAGPGAAGGIDISAGSLVLDGHGLGLATGIFAQTNYADSSGLIKGGAGGMVNVSASNVSVLNGADLSSSTFGSGNGGAVSIHAGNLNVGNSTFPSALTYIRAQAGNGSTGDAGALSVTVDRMLAITAGGQLTTSTSGSGRGGNLTVHAGSLSINGSAAPDLFTGIFTEADSGLTGNAGTLSVTVDHMLSIAGAGTVSTTTFGSGRGGDLTVHAGNLRIDGSATPYYFTGIAAQTLDDATGDAGRLSVMVDGMLSISSGGTISTTTFGRGRSGDLTVRAGSLSIDGGVTPDFFTGIAAQAETGSTGQAGALSVTVDQMMSISGGGKISATTFGVGNGGNLAIRAGALSIDGSAAPNYLTGIFTQAREGSAGNAGTLSVTVNHLLSIAGSGQISADTDAAGRGGNLSIRAGNIVVDGSAVPQFFTGISASANEGSTGRAGYVSVTASGSLMLTGGGSISTETNSIGKGGDIIVNAPTVYILRGSQIFADTYSDGNAGNVNLNTGRLLINGAGAESFTGVSSESFYTGQAGSVTIRAGGLSLLNGGEITASAYHDGAGGSVHVFANTALIQGSNGDSPSGVFAAAHHQGSAGDVSFQSNSLTLLAGGLISSSTEGSGSAGGVTVNAGQILIDGQRTSENTGIFSDADTGSKGRAGNVSVTANGLTIANGGEIAADTYGSGNGGSVALRAGNLVIDGSGSDFFTGARAVAQPGSTGSAGNVEVTANRATLVGDGQISAQTNGPGNAGDVNLNIAGQLNMSSGSEVTASTSGSGDAGTVSITAKDLIMSTGAQIGSLSSGSGNAGGLFINLKNDLHMNSNSLITVESLRTSAGDAFIKAGGSIFLDQSAIRTSAAQNGGSVLLSAQDFIRLDGSRITAEAQGNGGNIFLRDARFALFNDSVLTANAVTGSGGLIQIGTQVLLTNNSFITASSQFGADGEVRIDALYDLSGTTRALEDKVLDASDQLQPRCHAKIPGESGSFILMGKGGLPVMPGRYLPAHLLMDLPEE